MNDFTTYILFSRSKNKYYVGHTNNISRRLI
ncbi:MAG: GIY-YIG nuclease family protein, partial [Melioribacteraceae bacterium]